MKCQHKVSESSRGYLQVTRNSPFLFIFWPGISKDHKKVTKLISISKSISFKTFWAQKTKKALNIILSSIIGKALHLNCQVTENGQTETNTKVPSIHF